jgi:hypothetical protein
VLPAVARGLRGVLGAAAVDADEVVAELFAHRDVQDAVADPVLAVVRLES